MENDGDSAFPIFIAGAISGVIAFGFLLLIFRYSDISQHIREYQSLFAGILGVLAAGFTALILIWQIRQNYNLHRDAQLRRLLAAKSTLPLALADFSKYASKCFVISVNMARGVPISEALPHIPDIHLEVFKECIEQSDASERRQLSDVLSVYQVQRSRMATAFHEYEPTTLACGPHDYFHINEEVDKTAMLSGHLQSSAELQMLVDNLWSFARSKEYEYYRQAYEERIRNLFTFTVKAFPEEWPRTIRIITRVMTENYGNSV